MIFIRKFDATLTRFGISPQWIIPKPPTVEEVMEEFAVTREQINAVLHFAAQSLGTPIPPPVHAAPVDAHSL